MVNVLKISVQNFFFPALILGVLITDLILWRLGFTPSQWIIYTYNGTAILLIALEFLIPRNAQWNYINKDGIKLREISVETFFFFAGGWFAGVVTYPFSLWVAGHLRQTLGITESLPLPWIAQAVIIVLMIDFLRYWIHRWSHEFAILWRFHALHHVPGRLGAMSATRTHPVDDFLLYVPELILVFSLGFNPTLVAILYSVIWVVALAKHANIEMKENWFTRHFQIPRYHLRHHECHDGSVPTANFSEVLTFWDRVFGTFADAEVTADHAVGVVTEKKRSVWREVLGWAYLRTDKL